jgi:ferric-dicitrate binding protein FerR (iron transport regulator)
MSSNLPESSSDQDVIAQLLRLAPSQADVPVDRERRVKQVVLDECRAVSRRRRTERRAFVAAAALATAAAVAMTTRIWPRSEALLVPGVLATIDRLEGEVRVAATGRDTEAKRPAWLADALSVGGEIETAAGRAGLRLARGGSLRIDRNSRVRLLSAEAIELSVGGVYLDVTRETGALEVRTPFGVVKDIGTQFEVRFDASTLRVRVRSGKVEVHGRDGAEPAEAGTEIIVGAEGTKRRTVAADDPVWEWTIGLAPAFRSDGRPLGAFLAHLCREQGWTLTYSSPELAREVSAIVLHGSLEGLKPSDALEVALAASALDYRIGRGSLLVLRRIDR